MVNDKSYCICKQRKLRSLLMYKIEFLFYFRQHFPIRVSEHANKKKHLTFFQNLQNQTVLPAVTSVIDGLKVLYKEKLKPLEATYRFNDFESPFLVSHLMSIFYIEGLTSFV